MAEHDRNLPCETPVWVLKFGPVAVVLEWFLEGAPRWSWHNPDVENKSTNEHLCDFYCNEFTAITI